MWLHFHREGSGPPLVLLHGIAHHWQAWRPVIDRLASEFDVIACDLPGFGRSAPLPGGVDPTIPAYAGALARWFEEMGLQRPHVAGNSMGGAIALELADRGRAASAVAISPAGFWTSPERRYCQMSLGVLARVPTGLRPLLLRLMDLPTGRRAVLGQYFGQPARVPAEEVKSTLRDAWAAPGFDGARQAFSRYRYNPPASAGRTPIIVAWGRKDRLLPYRLQAPRARRALPGAQHLTLGAGHVPFFDDPEAVSAVIRSAAAAASGGPG